MAAAPAYVRCVLTLEQMTATATRLGECDALGSYPEEIDVYRAVLREHPSPVLTFPAGLTLGKVADAYDAGRNAASALAPHAG